MPSFHQINQDNYEIYFVKNTFYLYLRKENWNYIIFKIKWVYKLTNI